MRSYLSYDNRRGNTYGAGLKAGSYVHTRGWNAGVNVTVRYAGPDGKQDAFDVYMTAGSSGYGQSTHLGTVTDTPDGPHWAPAARIPALTDDDQSTGAPDDPTEEDHGLAVNALQLAIAALRTTDPANVQTAIEDLTAELARITR